MVLVLHADNFQGFFSSVQVSNLHPCYRTMQYRLQGSFLEGELLSPTSFFPFPKLPTAFPSRFPGPRVVPLPRPLAPQLSFYWPRSPSPVGILRLESPPILFCCIPNPCSDAMGVTSIPPPPPRPQMESMNEQFFFQNVFQLPTAVTPWVS
jgi:hypothetical protein